jgi:two-component system response regulator NreC
MILEAPGLQPSSAAKNKSTSDRVRILIADDYQSVLQQAVSLLQPYFEIVGTATNGKMLTEEAIRLAPDIIVSDILMPGLNGIDAARLLREGGCTAKIIFLSVYESEEFVKACFAEGGSGYVTKSRMGVDLVPAITAVLNGQQFVSPTVQD